MLWDRSDLCYRNLIKADLSVKVMQEDAEDDRAASVGKFHMSSEDSFQPTNY